MLSSRGYGVIAHTYANGTRFDMSSDRTSVSTRALAGPLTLEFMCQSTPQRACGRSADKRIPSAAAGVGLRVLEEPRRARGIARRYRTTLRLPAYEIPLDAIVIDSPWATQIQLVGDQTRTSCRTPSK